MNVIIRFEWKLPLRGRITYRHCRQAKLPNFLYSLNTTYWRLMRRANNNNNVIITLMGEGWVRQKLSTFTCSNCGHSVRITHCTQSEQQGGAFNLCEANMPVKNFEKKFKIKHATVECNTYEKQEKFAKPMKKSILFQSVFFRKCN